MTRVRTCLAAIALAVVPGASEAAMRCVNTAGRAPCFGTIQSAVDAAGPGDLVTIAPGTYYENVLIPPGKDRLRIVGASPATVIIDADAPNPKGAGVIIFSPGMTVRNLTIRNGDFGIVLTVSAEDVVLQGLQVAATRLVGVQSSGRGMQILSSGFRAIGGVSVQISGLGTVVRGNTFEGTRQAVSGTAADLQVLSNRFQVAETGVRIGADRAVVEGNVFESVDEAIAVTGEAPVVRANRHTIGTHLAQVTCTGCTGGSITGNVGSGVAQGIAVTANDAGLLVQGNRITAATNAYSLAGTGIYAPRNAASDAASFCFVVDATNTTLDRNSATRCGAVGYYTRGSANLLSGNTASESGVFGFAIVGADNSLNDNRAALGDGQGFGIIDFAATGTTLEGNVGVGNRLDFCNSSGNPPAIPVPDNTFGPDSQSATCDLAFFATP